MTGEKQSHEVCMPFGGGNEAYSIFTVFGPVKLCCHQPGCQPTLSR